MEAPGALDDNIGDLLPLVDEGAPGSELLAELARLVAAVSAASQQGGDECLAAQHELFQVAVKLYNDLGLVLPSRTNDGASRRAASPPPGDAARHVTDERSGSLDGDD